MQPRTPRSSRVALRVGALSIALAVAAGPVLPGCSPASNPPAAATKPDQTYTVRGQIVMLPDRAKPASEFQIRHEPIPSFVNKDGKIVGMNAMVMPFTPAPALPLKDFAVGDIVEFTFEVRWKSRPASLVTALKKLPAGTTLDFGRAKPAG